MKKMSEELKKLKPFMHTTYRKSHYLNKEISFAICDRNSELIPSEEFIGEKARTSVPECGIIGERIGVFHTHPVSEVSDLSGADILTHIRYNIPFACVSSKEGLKCFEITPTERAKETVKKLIQEGVSEQSPKFREVAKQFQLNRHLLRKEIDMGE